MINGMFIDDMMIIGPATDQQDGDVIRGLNGFAYRSNQHQILRNGKLQLVGTQIFEDMLGCTMLSIKVNKEKTSMILTSNDYKKKFVFEHSQDCCESVEIIDICGELNDLIGSPIVEACEVTRLADPMEIASDSGTWTFYRFSTSKGTVTIRWLGTSNGYYSESVSYKVIESIEDVD